MVSRITVPGRRASSRLPKARRTLPHRQVTKNADAKVSPVKV